VITYYAVASINQSSSAPRITTGTTIVVDNLFPIGCMIYVVITVHIKNYVESQLL